MAYDRNKMLQEGVTRLDEAQSIANGTHRVALEVMGTMQDQRLQLQNAADKIQGAKDNTQVSGKYITGMERREMLYKLLLSVVAVVLFLLIVSLLYIKVTRSHR